jgi:uncharacterized membrane protein YbaN (DUF454 family)
MTPPRPPPGHATPTARTPQDHGAGGASSGYPDVAPQEHRSAVVRAVVLVIGSTAFVLAVLGVLLPLVPATPLFILAAACFARAYRPFHQWMLDHRLIGPPLREWYRHRSLPYRIKVVAVVTMLVSFGSSIALVVRPLWLKFLLGACAAGLAWWIYRIPSRDRPASPARKADG